MRPARLSRSPTGRGESLWMRIEKAQLKLWTREAYESLAEAGAFAPGERVELMEGLIIAMSPHNVPHSRSLSHGNHLFVGLFGATHYVRVQLPLNLAFNSQLEPDFALVLKHLVDTGNAHPASADLVVEVSESSLSYDRNAKARVYARAGIPEYWIVNLKAGVLEVYRDPDPAAAKPVYLSRQVLQKNESIAPLFSPQTLLLAGDLF